MVNLSNYEILSRKNTEDHISSCLSRPVVMKFRGGWTELKPLYNIISSHAESKRFLDDCVFGKLFRIDIKKNDQRLAECLVERWWCNTHTFHFPNFEIGITPLDFTMLTGIPVGIGNPPPFSKNLEKEKWDVFKDSCISNLFEGKDATFGIMKSRGLRLSYLKAYIVSREGKDNNECWKDMVRCFLLWVIGQVLYGESSGVVYCGWYEAVHDLDKVDSYDWGSAILARLYRSLDEGSRGSKSFSGMWMILEYWFYTYFQTCVPSLAEGQLPSVDVWPRVELYNRVNRSEKLCDVGKHSFQLARQQIDLRTAESTIWMPWVNSSFSEVECIVLSRRLSQCRVCLYDPEQDKGWWYLGDRCWRQVTGSIAIPNNPPPVAGLGNVDGSLIFHVKNWQSAKDFVVDCTDVEYLTFWRHVSIGPYTVALRFADNCVEAGFSATQDKKFNVMCPAPINQCRPMYDIQMEQPVSSPICDRSMIISSSTDEPSTIPVTSTSPSSTVWDPEIGSVKTSSELVELSSSATSRFTWKIENFSNLNPQAGLLSDVFSVGSFKWKALIYPKGAGKVYDHLSLFLCPIDLTESLCAEFSFAITSQIDCTNRIRHETNYKFPKKLSNCFGWTSFLRLSELHDPVKGYLVNDTCIITVEVTCRMKEAANEDCDVKERDTDKVPEVKRCKMNDESIERQ